MPAPPRILKHVRASSVGITSQQRIGFPTRYFIDICFKPDREFIKLGFSESDDLIDILKIANIFPMLDLSHYLTEPRDVYHTIELSDYQIPDGWSKEEYEQTIIDDYKNFVMVVLEV